MNDSYNQHWNPEQYRKDASFVAELGLSVVGLLAPRAGERVLDLGCGDGALTSKLVEQGCEVVGVDASAEMVAAACALGLDARVADGRALPFTNEFDAVFSNAALHWMEQPAQVVAGVWRALKPGGRFVGEFGGYGNLARIIAALDAALAARNLAFANPWYFPQAAEFAALLAAQGFAVTSSELFPRRTPLPSGLASWLEMFAQLYTAQLPAAERDAFIAEVVDSLRDILSDGTGILQADYVRLRFAATKPAAAT